MLSTCMMCVGGSSAAAAPRTSAWAARRRCRWRRSCATSSAPSPCSATSCAPAAFGSGSASSPEVTINIGLVFQVMLHPVTTYVGKDEL